MSSWSNNHRAVAFRHGLVVDDDSHIHGVIDRIPIAILRAPHFDENGRTSGGADDSVYNALLPHHAPFWFNVAERTGYEKLSAFFKGLVTKPSRDARFDQRFVIHADDPAKVAAMFDDEAHAVLLKLADDHHHPLLVAQMLSLRRMYGGLDGQPQIEGALRDLVAAAHSFARAFMTASMSGAYR